MDRNSVMETTKHQENINVTPVQVEELQNLKFTTNFINHMASYETKEREQSTITEDESYESEEELQRKRLGEYYDLSKHMTGTRHHNLLQLAYDERRTDKAINKKYFDFLDVYKSLGKDYKTKFEPIVSYVNNVFEETEILKKYIDDVIKRPEPRLEEEKIVYQKHILSEISKVNYIKNQHAISIRLITGYLNNFKDAKFVEKEGQSEHVLSAVGSMFTGFGELKDANYKEEDTNNAVLRAEAVKCLLLRHGSKHAVRSTSPEERVEEIRKRLVDDCVEKPDNASKKELRERDRELEPYKERFKKLISHDEKNEFSPFWIPLSMKVVEEKDETEQTEGEAGQTETKDKKSKAKKTKVKEEQLVTLNENQINIMNEASLDRYVLSSLCENIKYKNPNSAGAKMAELFDKAVIGLNSTMCKYSYDAHEQTEKILYDSDISEADKKKQLTEIRDRLVELSRYHGQVCRRMGETLGLIANKWTGNTISEKEEQILSVLENAKKKLDIISPSAKSLKDESVNLKVSDERCEKGIEALDEFERYSVGLVLTTVRTTDKKTNIVSGDTEYRKGEELEKQFGSELRFIDIAKRYRTDDIVVVKNELEQLRVDSKIEVKQDIQGQQIREEQNQTKQEKVSKISHIEDGLEKHIPKTEMEKLKSYNFKGGEYKGVGKCRAFWLRHGFISGDKLKNAVDAHVDRMLQSKELTDEDLALAASNIGVSTEVISDDMLNNKLKNKEKSVIYTRLEAFKNLSKETNDEDISESSKKIIKLLGAQEQEHELDYTDEYFEKYPQSLKLVLLYKLIKDITISGDDKKSVEMRDRIEAAKSGVEKLYNALRESDNYKNALAVQNQKSVNVDYNSLSDMMFKDRKDLASGEIETALDWSDYINKHTDKTTEGLKERKKYSEIAKELLEKQEKQRQEDNELYKKLSLDKKKERIRNHYERILRRAQESTQKDRIKELVRKPVPLPDYIKKVGASAFDDVLKAELNNMLIRHFAEEKVEKYYADNEDELIAKAKEYAIKTGYAGVKKAEDLGEFTLEQLREFAALVSVRLAEYPKLLNDISKKMKLSSPAEFTKEHRDYMISQMFTGNKINVEDMVFSLELLNKRKEFLDKNKYAVLLGGKELVYPRFYNDLTHIRINTGIRKEVRSENRINRMEKNDNLIENTCKELGVQKPKSFYEYAMDIKLKEEEDRRAKKKVNELSENDIIQQYKNYVRTTWFESVKFNEKDKKNKDKNKKANERLEVIVNTLSSTSGSKRKINLFKYYGLLKYGVALSGGIGTIKKEVDGKQVDKDILNEIERDEFEANLSKNVINNIVSKEVRCRIYCKEKNIEFTEALEKQLLLIFNDEHFDHKMMSTINGLKANTSNELDKYIERRDKRVKVIRESGYGMLLPILFENEFFTEHLVADNEKEFDDFFYTFFPRAKSVVEEISNNPYGEQYLLGKKNEILDFIFSEKSKGISAKDYLKLGDYNIVIEDTVLKRNGDKKITLKEIIDNAVTQVTSSNPDALNKEKIIFQEGNIHVMALLFDGVGALFDKNKMDAYRKRVNNNTEALNIALDKVFEEKKAAGKTYAENKQQAFKESISQSERKNLFLIEEKEYQKDLIQRIRDWIDELELIDIKEAENNVMREEIQNNMQQLLNIKKAGRMRFAEYHSYSDKMRMVLESDYKKMVKETGSRAKADAFFADKLNKLNKNVSSKIDEFLSNEKDNLPGDGSLNSFYNETLIRMSYHASHEDVKQAELDLMLDYKRFYNVRSFYETALNFLNKYETTKDYQESTKKNIIGGLLNYYGEQLLSESYISTDDVINEELEKLFEDKNVGKELLRLLEHDSGGYYGVGSDGYNYSDNPLEMLDRKQFEQKLSDKAGSDKALKKEFDDYNSLDDNTKILVGHILLREANSYNYGGFFVKTFLSKNNQATSRTDVIQNYIKGEELAEPDYKQVFDILLSEGSVSSERLHSALFFAKDVKELKEVDGLAVDQKTYKSLIEGVNTEKEKVRVVLTEEETFNQAEDVLAIAEAVARDFEIEKYRTNIDKMWSFYSVLRPFKNEIKAYEKVHVKLSSRVREDRKDELAGVTDERKIKEINDRADARLKRLMKVNDLCRRFKDLEGYVNLIRSNEPIKEVLESDKPKKAKDEAWKNAYKTRFEMAKIESRFHKILGLTGSYNQVLRDDESLRNGTASVSKFKTALNKNTEYKRDEFSDFLDKQVLRVDGVKTKSSMMRTDSDEKEFPEEVVNAVYEIDRWVAKYGNSLAKGNSESTFAADILSHPMRERLFVYYMVEKQRLDNPSGVDAAMAINGYVPNYDKFCEAVNAPKYKIHQYLISAIKDTDFVRNHESVRGALAGFGSLNLESIESAIRLLDDEKSQVSNQLKYYKEALNSDYSDILSRYPNNESLKNYLMLKRDRQEKLKMMLFSLEKSRELSQISDEAVINKKEKAEAAMKQAHELRLHMMELVAADKELAKEEDKVKNDKTLEDILNKEFGRKIYNPDDAEQSTAEKIDGYVDKANTIAGLLSTADEKLFKTGIFATVNGVTALSKIITTCFASDFVSEERSFNQKLTDATTIMDAISDAAEPVAEMLKTILGSSSELFGTVGGVISSGLTVVTGTVETAQSIHNQHTVNKAKENTTEKTKEMVKEAEKTGDKNKVRDAKELARAAYNVSRMQDNKYGTRKVQSALKATGGAISIATAFVPGLNVAGAIAGGVVKAVSVIHKFYKEKENRNDALDYFLGMDQLIAEFKKSRGVMDYGSDDDKELIRNMMLRKFHFSSAEQFFNDLSMKYARHLYDQIFFKSDGTLIREGDTDEIAARKEFTDLFPELKFIWPAEGGAPHPSVEEMAADLMKLS